MQLNELKPQWTELNDADKINLIETTNERRVASFNVKVKRKKRKTAKKSTKSRSRKRAPKDPKKLADHVKSTMTDEQKENFLLMLQMQQDK